MSKELNEKFSFILEDLDIDLAMKYFTREKYLPFMDGYCERNTEVYDLILSTMENDEDWEAQICEAAAIMAENAKARIKKSIFFKRQKQEIDMAYGITCFVFPGLLTLSEKNEKIGRVCEIVSSEWGKVFPKVSNIGAATKEEIHSGFKRKIFGIPLD